jgi:hypothetical protein
MIGAAAAMLFGLCASDAETALLRRALPPQWTVAADAPPVVELRYRRDPGRLVISGARAAVPLTPSATLFMQARKPIENTQWDPLQSAGTGRGRAYSVGLALRW